ncbi:MAG TPA: 50S ribosomal protein L11 methyltransferase [Pyrinomonadaceae bacterium]|nr:50S ribosomal protein L11 methyltransferase [Pyrinomonadaceae bacterium]
MEPKDQSAIGNRQSAISNEWHALDLEVEAAAREAVEYALMEAGSGGTETVDKSEGLVQVTGYFPNTPQRELVRYQLAEALRVYDLPSSCVRDMNLRVVPERDWLAEWKQSWQPVDVGKFVITPPWIEIPESGDRVVITIEPGMAFGTGTHETSRLCLAAIEEYFTGESFLDVGTGTGILAIAAAKLKPEASIQACDTDEAAISVAIENARINKVAKRISFVVGSVHDEMASADLVCANLTADVIIEIMPTLLQLTCGRLILSGILTEQVSAVYERLLECGVSGEVQKVYDGEWAALIV